MSSYDTSPLASGENDGIQMTKFLSENCKFDVTHIHDASPSEISSAFSALDAKLALAKNGSSKVAAFVYYSGHGLLKGFTVGVALNGDEFPLEKNIRNMSMRPNCYVIGFLDCCRSIPKEDHPIPEKIPGMISDI